MFPDVFLAHYAPHADFAKSNRFAALIYQPPGLVAGGLLGGLIGQTQATKFLMKPLNTAGLSFQCETASLPGYQINTVEQKIFGAPWSVAANPGDYTPLELTFICAGDLWERKFFEDWMEFIVPKGSIRKTADTIVSDFIAADGISRAAGSASYRNDYISTIQIISFHETGIPNARYTYEECYPVAVAPQPVSWGDDQISRLNVTFKYTSWSREKNILNQIYDQFRNP
jgi:hypothetical protein